MSDAKNYDVFLSHNSKDKPAVKALAQRLQERGITVFLDEWHLIPGEPWMKALEEALDQSRTCAVFIGAEGIGPWERQEMQVAINKRVALAESSFRVIPVLLPDAAQEDAEKLPGFLNLITRVAFTESLEDEEAFLSLIAGIKGIEPVKLTSSQPFKGLNPYRGLQVFDVEHAPFFFGREAAVEKLIEKLQTNNFLAVIGPSGSGKSSLVRAGLVPAIQSGKHLDSDQWPICILKPDEHPLDSLATALGTAYDTNRPLLATLADGLKQNQRTLHMEGKAIVEASEGRKLVVVVDQFEEAFTLCKNEEERHAFIDNLLYASSVEQSCVVVILSMRADFYGKCAQYPDLADRITDAQMLLNPMTTEELRNSIEEPAKKAGLTFEPGLVDTLLRDIEGEPGNLPLLQHALFELYRTSTNGVLTSKAYREIGGIKGSIAKRAETIYNSLNPDDQKTMRHVMLNLIAPGQGTEDTRRRASLVNLLPTGSRSQQTEDIIQLLSGEETRLITTTSDKGGHQKMVEVSHEALIKHWDRLKGWADEDREFLTWRSKLRNRQEEWLGSGQDKSLLLRGVLLAEAEEYVVERREQLTVEEEEYIEESLKGKKTSYLKKSVCSDWSINARYSGPSRCFYC